MSDLRIAAVTALNEKREWIAYWNENHQTWSPITGVLSVDAPVTMRPLVVIDPDDREQVERLCTQMGAHGWSGIDDEAPSDMQAVLRSLIERRPPEPSSLGAVAQSCGRGALVRVTPDDRPGLWVNSRLPDEVLAWDQISMPLVVLSEGVTA